MTPSAPAPSAAEIPPGSLADQLNGPLGFFLQHRVLPSWIQGRRWFRSKSRPLRAVTFEAVFPCDAPATTPGDAVFAIARVTFDEGPHELYVLPLALAPAEAAPTADLPEAALVGPVTTPDGTRLLIDGCWHAGFRAGLYQLLAGQIEADNTLEDTGHGGALRGHPVSATTRPQTDSGSPEVSGEGGGFEGLTAETGDESRVLGAEHSNTALVYGRGADAVFVKLYRRLEAGPHPEPEMLRFLSGRTAFRSAPAFFSALAWTNGTGASCTAALAQEFFEGARDAWDFMLEALRAGKLEEPVAAAAQMGRLVSAFHGASASQRDEAAFAPEAFTAADAEATRVRARASLAAGSAAAARRGDAASAELQALRTEDMPRLFAAIDAAADVLKTAAPGAAGFKIRTHGDLHLGQLLIREARHGAGRDIRILDFEGEPGRPLADARVKTSAWRDVAGMLRSFHYAAHAAVLLSEGQRPAPAGYDPEAVADALRAAFLEGYRDADEGGQSRNPGGTEQALLTLFLLEKAAYELQYECDNRPDWITIPLRGLRALAAA